MSAKETQMLVNPSYLRIFELHLVRKKVLIKFLESQILQTKKFLVVENIAYEMDKF